MRRLAPLMVWLGLAALAAVALAQVGGARSPRAQVAAATGAFQISNSRDGAAIFAAAGLAPGEPARGAVTIENTGSEAAALLLRHGEPTDVPGLGGGLLSGRLWLRVTDVSAPAAPRPVYAGPLASMPDQALGALGPGDARTFEFTATLPDGVAPSVQNAVQGASTTVAYSWIARESQGGEGGEEPGGEGGPGAEPPGGGGKPTGPSPVPGGGTGQGGAPVDGRGGGPVPGPTATLDLTVSKVRSALRGRRLVVWTGCTEACRLDVRGRLRVRAGGRRRSGRLHLTRRLQAGATRRLRIPVPRRLRRQLRGTHGRGRLYAKLRFVAIAADGDRDAAARTLRLRPRSRHRHHRARPSNAPRPAHPPVG